MLSPIGRGRHEGVLALEANRPAAARVRSATPRGDHGRGPSWATASRRARGSSWPRLDPQADGWGRMQGGDAHRRRGGALGRPGVWTTCRGRHQRTARHHLGHGALRTRSWRSRSCRPGAGPALAHQRRNRAGHRHGTVRGDDGYRPTSGPSASTRGTPPRSRCRQVRCTRRSNALQPSTTVTIAGSERTAAAPMARRRSSSPRRWRIRRVWRSRSFASSTPPTCGSDSSASSSPAPKSKAYTCTSSGERRRARPSTRLVRVVVVPLPPRPYTIMLPSPIVHPIGYWAWLRDRRPWRGHGPGGLAAAPVAPLCRWWRPPTVRREGTVDQGIEVDVARQHLRHGPRLRAARAAKASPITCTAPTVVSGSWGSRRHGDAPASTGTRGRGGARALTRGRHRCGHGGLVALARRQRRLDATTSPVPAARRPGRRRAGMAAASGTSMTPWSRWSPARAGRCACWCWPDLSLMAPCGAGWPAACARRGCAHRWPRPPARR